MDGNNPIATEIQPPVGTPPAQPPAPPPPAEPGPAAPPPAEDTPNMEDLQAELEKAQNAAKEADKKRIAAEQAIELTKKENSRLKKAQMTEAEQLEERRREVEEEARLYRTSNSRLAAKELLVPLGLAEDDMKEGLELFVGEDAEKSGAIAQWMVDMVKKQTQAAAKAEREKVLKETPAAPGGGGTDEDPLLAAFRKG